MAHKSDICVINVMGVNAMRTFRPERLIKRRGFTLVELIIVIAIIAILAAILVPTFLNVATSSRVASANSTAASIKKDVSVFLTNADSDGWGMMKSSANTCALLLAVDRNGKWSCTAASASFSAHPSISWGSAANGIDSDTPRTSLTSGEALLCARLSANYPQLKSASVMVSFLNGECAAAAFSKDAGGTQLSAGTDYPALSGGAFPENFSWNNNTQGVTSTGIIVGTAPAVALA